MYCTLGLRLLGLSLAILLRQLLLDLCHLFIGGASDVDCDFFAELLGDLLEREARGLREEEVDHWNEDHRPANDDQVVLPTDVGETNGGGLKKDKRRWMYVS